MNSKSNFIVKNDCHFHPLFNKQKNYEVYPLSGRFSRAKDLIDRFENELKLHPVLYNNLIETLLTENGKEKYLANLDPEVYKLNFKSSEDDEDDNKMITKLFEQNEIKSSKRELFPKTSLFSLKEKSETEVKIEPRKSKSNEKVQVYTKQHFEWLFKQDKKHQLYKKLDINHHESHVEKQSKKGQNLEQKIKEFCAWAELNYDCKELELDAITLMKIFLVNYDKGPLMWAPINLQEINRKEFKQNIDTNSSSEFDSWSEKSSITKTNINEKKKSYQNKIHDKNSLKSSFQRRKNYGKWYVPKKYWSKIHQKQSEFDKNETIYDNKTISKLFKSNGVKLFRDFFSKKNKRPPYFLEQNRKKNFIVKI